MNTADESLSDSQCDQHIVTAIDCSDITRVDYNSTVNHRRTQTPGNVIPVRITTRTGQYDDGKGEFLIYTRKLTKHFCVLSLSRNLKTNLLEKDITSKGPSVTNMRVFPSRRNTNHQVLKFGLFINNIWDCLLEEDFWPSYVSFTGWVPRGQRPDSRFTKQQHREGIVVRRATRGTRALSRLCFSATTTCYHHDSGTRLRVGSSMHHYSKTWFTSTGSNCCAPMWTSVFCVNMYLNIAVLLKSLNVKQ